MTWTQPLCSTCWNADPARSHDRPNRRPYDQRQWETCCICGEETCSGIYATYNPAAVDYPKTDVAHGNQNGETL
jgi:hypothetical protein